MNRKQQGKEAALRKPFGRTSKATASPPVTDDGKAIAMVVLGPYWVTQEAAYKKIFV